MKTDLKDIWSRMDESAVEELWPLGEMRLQQIGASNDIGPLLAGTTRGGERHLLIPLVEPNQPRLDDESAGIWVEERTYLQGPEEKWFLDIKCRKPELRDLFELVAQEMLESVTASPSGDDYKTCVVVLDKWRRLLAKERSSLLSEKKQVGLLAELRVLENLAYASAEALAAWTGPEAQSHDFMTDSFHVEVKGTRRSGWGLDINGVKQLEVYDGFPLYLHVVRYESTPHGAICLPDSIKRTLAAGVPAAPLFDKLQNLGYFQVDADDYERQRFDLIDERCFLVGDDFPRVVPASFIDEVPERVSNLKYRLDLNDLSEDFIVGETINQALSRWRR